MKPARIFLGLVVCLLALLLWRFWPAASSPEPTATAPGNNPPATASVELPKAAPAQPMDAPTPTALPLVVNTANATVLADNRQETLDGLLKFQTTLEQSLSTTTDPRDRDALEHELTQLQTQIQYEISSSATPPVVTTNLGNLTLSEGQPVQQKLASGDEATLTASTSADGNWLVNVVVQHTDASGVASVESTSVTLQPGQPAVVKTRGNEIHFTPVAAGSTPAN
jgi:hypothetical protein